MPFGGAKMSGVGREGLKDSLEFYTEVKTVCIKHRTTCTAAYTELSHRDVTYCSF